MPSQFRVRQVALAAWVILLSASCGRPNRPLLVIANYQEWTVELYAADNAEANVNLLASIPRDNEVIGYAFYPSPGLSYLAWTETRDFNSGTGSLHMLDIGSGRQTVVTSALLRLDGAYFLHETNSSGYNVSWSPDGSALLYLSTEGVEVYEIERAETVSLTDDNRWHHAPVWSPDGQEVAMVSWVSSSDAVIEVVSRDGRTRRTVVDLAKEPTHKYINFHTNTECGLQWSPTGEHVAFIVGLGCESTGSSTGLTEVFVADVESGETQQVTWLSHQILEGLDETFQVRAEYALGWSPNGKQLLVGYIAVATNAFSSALPPFTSFVNRGLQVIDIDRFEAHSLTVESDDFPGVLGMSFEWVGENAAWRLNTFDGRYDEYRFAKIADGRISWEELFPGFKGGCDATTSPDLKWLAYQASVGEPGDRECGEDVLVVSYDGSVTNATTTLSGENRIVGWYSKK